MTAAPFAFQTPAEYARTHPAIDEAFAIAEAADTDLRARMYVGLVSRPDITAPRLRAALKYAGRGAWTLLAAILNSPTMARSPKTHAEARRYIAADSVPTLLEALHDRDLYLRDFLRIAQTHSMFPDIIERVRSAFPADQIAAELDAMVEEWCTTARATPGAAPFDTTVPELVYLTAEHVARIVEVTHDLLKATGSSDYSIVVGRLLRRADLTEATAHRLLDCFLLLIEADAVRYGELGMRHGYGRFGVASQYVRMLDNPGLPDSVFTRALLVPEIIEALDEDPSLRLPLTPEAVLNAVRAGAPLTVLDRFYLHSLPIDVLDKAIADLSADEGQQGNVGVLTLLIRSSTDTIGTPQWDSLYALWCAQVSPEGFASDAGAAVVDGFVGIVKGRALNWADHSTSPILNRFAAWASASPDARLRRHAVAESYLPEQIVAATNDPSGLVRVEVLSHPLVTDQIINGLAGDPDPLVRLAVAEHELATEATFRRLADDPDEAVRVAVAERFMSALR